MPIILDRTPKWLLPGTPGFRVFSPSKVKRRAYLNDTSENVQECVPRRTIAHRGNETFMVVGNEIRWANLLHLQTRHRPKTPAEADSGQAYKVLKPRWTVPGQITELSISPKGDMMAICTSHTVHVALVPDSAILSNSADTTIKLTTFQLGPTTHVLDMSPLASTLWHPLGRNGHCLVTVTADANVRVWELNRENRCTFSEPQFGMNLRKLGNAEDSTKNCAASRLNEKTGYGPDSVEMVVAAATFGTSGRKGERGWGPMTLWIVMQQGDMYALCPFLPTVWQYTSHDDLSESLGQRLQLLRPECPESVEDEDFNQYVADQQNEWIGTITSDFEDDPETGGIVEIYSTDLSWDPLPRLQGPFIHNPDIVVDFEVTDIMLVTPGEAGQDGVHVGGRSSNVSAICVVTNRGRMHIFLDFCGVEGQWLPRTKTTNMPKCSHPKLSFVKVVEFQPSDDDGPFCRPVLTGDPKGRFALFISTDTGVYFVSLVPWLRPLHDELSNPECEGAMVRVSAIMKGPKTILERVIEYNQDQRTDMPQSTAVCIAVESLELGYALLTSEGAQPYYTVLDELEIDKPDSKDDLDPVDREIERLRIPNPRQTYQPPPWLPSFESELTMLIKDAPQHDQNILKEPLRPTDTTLKYFTRAHRSVSREAEEMNKATASIFICCKRMLDHLKDQVGKVNALEEKVEVIAGGQETHKMAYQRRLDDIQATSKRQKECFEEIMCRAAKLDGRALGRREKALSALTISMDQQLKDDGKLSVDLRAIKTEMPDLVRQADALARSVATPAPDTRIALEEDSGQTKIPDDIRQEHILRLQTLMVGLGALAEKAWNEVNKLPDRATVSLGTRSNGFV